jgi:Protein of unknown function (DUF3025)
MNNAAHGDALHRQLASIDWLAPWWEPWRNVGQRVAQRVLAGAPVHAALQAEANSTATPAAMRNAPIASPNITFVAQSALPDGVAYEAFIYRTGSVPTRQNLHDFFNGLVWLVFPRTKRRLNFLQASEIHASGVQTTRGPLRDALTLFDENAAIWPLASAAPTELLDALRAKQWQHACVHLRAHWLGGAPILLGHALLEKLVTPYKSITAHVFVTHTLADCAAPLQLHHTALSALDAATAQQLSAASLVPKPFIALPVLGVPHWWPANAEAGFYDDVQVFRPPKP